jgi:hypothetical protein
MEDRRVPCRVCLGDLMERYHVEDVGIDVRILLK